MFLGGRGASLHSMTQLANREMAKVWDGEEGDDWTDNAERYDATDRYLWQQFVSKVPVGETDHVLDIGCGTGKSTREVARAARSGRVLGIDLSSRMLEYARRRSDEEGLTNVDYVQGDAQVHPFPTGAFDSAISVFGAMFFNDPVAAFSNIRSGLRWKGRLALLAWQPFEQNDWLRMMFDALAAGRQLVSPRSGMPGPFGLADDEAVYRILEEAGFVDVDITALDAPVLLGATADDAWEFVSGMGIVRGLTQDLGDDAKGLALARLREVIAAHHTPDGVLIGAAEWLITARGGAGRRLWRSHRPSVIR